MKIELKMFATGKINPLDADYEINLVSGLLCVQVWLLKCFLKFFNIEICFRELNLKLDIEVHHKSG